MSVPGGPRGPCPERGQGQGWDWSLYGEVQGIIGNGHMGLRFLPPNGKTEMTKNITLPQFN